MRGSFEGKMWLVLARERGTFFHLRRSSQRIQRHALIILLIMQIESAQHLYRSRVYVSRHFQSSSTSSFARRGALRRTASNSNYKRTESCLSLSFFLIPDFHCLCKCLASSVSEILPIFSETFEYLYLRVSFFSFFYFLFDCSTVYTRPAWEFLL